MTETEYTLEHADLTDPKGVEKFAVAFGVEWANAIAQASAVIPAEHLGIFFGCLFAAPFGAMSRRIGMENARRVTALLLAVCQQETDKRIKAAH